VSRRAGVPRGTPARRDTIYAVALEATEHDESLGAFFRNFYLRFINNSRLSGNIHYRNMKTTGTGITVMHSAALGAALLIGLATSAAAADPMPSYARGGEEAIRGRVSGFDGKYDLYVRDERGFVDHVRLHDGTIINPTGLRLSQGMRVRIYGHTDGQTFAANEIDTPYTVAYAYPGYPYYAYPWYGPPIYRVGFGFRFR